MKFEILKILGTALPIFIIFGYSLSRIYKRNDVADILWGLGFLLVSFIAVLYVDVLTFKAKLVIALVTIWSLRLSTYLFFRTIKKSEDIRYANWRKDWGKSEPLSSFLKVFLLQAILMGLISYPLALIIIDNSMVVGPFDFLALSLVIIGFLFESIGDYQLTKFKQNPDNKGKILSTGLWAYTRHPNYLGEILIWWGFFFFTITYSWWGYSLLSPILLTFLIIKVSGVSMLDDLMKDKGEEFIKYVQNVPTLFPFTKWHIVVALKSIFTVLILDFIWLGNLFNKFYISQSQHLTRIKDGNFDAVVWATIFVYLAIPLGIVYCAVLSSKTRSMSLFKGSIFGLVLYCPYEFTNIALVKDWPLEMALIDILWGPILCGLSAFFAFKERSIVSIGR